MNRRALIPWLIVLGLGLHGSACDLGGSGMFIVSPAADPPVTTTSFDVVVRIHPSIVASSLAATINGSPITLAPDGSGAYVASVSPGGALADDNVLVVSAETTGGEPRTETRSFQWLPPKARLRKITDSADLMSGPLAHGRVGDYLLANDTARFIVQDVGQRDLHSIGSFGGNLIDAELVGHPGLESFFEVQPAVNIETVQNSETAEIVNDGQNGLPAELRVCGPDDLMDYINPSTVVSQAGGNFPAGVDDLDVPVESCTTYTLDVGKRWVRMETTIENLSSSPLGLFVGDYVNGMGELDQWTPPRNPTPQTQLGIGEVSATFGNDVFAYVGTGEATGVDYAFVATGATASSSFTVSKVSYVMHANSIPVVLIFGLPSPFVVPGSGQASFTRWFGVGDGSGANAIAMQAELAGLVTGTLRGCVTVGGAPAAGARVSAGFASGGAITQVRGAWITDSSGCYEGKLPVGSYGVAGARTGTPYEAGGTTPLVHTVSVVANATTVQDIALPATGHVAVSVTDETGSPVPARITVVGFDPSPEPKLVTSSLSGNDTTTGVFEDPTSDPLAHGITRVVYTDANGQASFDLEPSTYEIVVSRGTEYSAFSAPLGVGAGNTSNVSAQIARVISTPGFVSSDYHVHALNSPDSSVSNIDRVRQFAGEGVDNVIMTDHDAHTDLDPVIASLGMTPFVASTVGEEITSFDYGHFNAYPLGIDPSRVSKGSTDHGGAAPIGLDFPSAGSYNLSPAQIHAAVLSDPVNTSPEIAVQINHISSHFEPLKIDSALTPPQSLLGPTEQASFRLDPSIPNLYHHFPALELWNGHNRSHLLSEFLNERIGIWMNLLNQGLATTAIADTDTHEFLNVRGGGARTWTASSTDAPPAIVDDEIGASVKTGRAIGGQGIFVNARLLANDGSGGVADLGLGSNTLVSVSNHQVDLEIRVQAPLWAEYDRIEVYVNAATQVTKRNPNQAGGTPVFYKSVPTLVLDAGSGFTVQTVNDYPAIPGASHRETLLTTTLAVPQDAWIVVLARGRDGISKPMFPVMPASLATSGNTTLANLLDGNLGEAGVPALGYTNALYVDTDGNSVFDPPGVVVVP
ncbi:hypothetical protein BURK2_01328 [Burkholderiales bacterium]|nr:hypothetical protein BURK2_01328 [Burkholderiales bacterium]